MRIVLALGMLLGLLSSPAYATKLLPGVPCKAMQENINLSVNFNIRAKSFTEAKAKFDEKMKQVTDFASQQKIKKFDLQSMSYSINTQVNYEDGMPEPGYQLSGNASYQLDSSESAFKLGEFLTQQKFQVNINASSYRNGNCTGEQAAPRVEE